jgi:hypothetical protein
MRLRKPKIRHARTAPPRLDPRTYPLRRRDAAGAPRRVGPLNECAVTTVERESMLANFILF